MYNTLSETHGRGASLAAAGPAYYLDNCLLRYLAIADGFSKDRFPPSRADLGGAGERAEWGMKTSSPGQC
jgi:hypothetical protein